MLVPMGDLPVLLNPSAFGQLIGILVAIPTLILAIRIPFKRSYHWVFIAFVVIWTVRFGVGLYAQSSQTPEIFFERAWWTWFLGPPSAPLLYHFTLLLGNTKMTNWQKYSLAGGYAYWLTTIQGFALLNPTLIFREPVRQTATGYATSPGLLDPILRPFGTAPVESTLYVLTLALLLKYSRRHGWSLTRTQIRYLSLGILVFFAGSYAWSWSRFVGGPQALPFLQALGMATLLLGLTRYNFLSITPSAEKVSMTPKKFDLKPGTSYLSMGPDSKYPFEVFSDLVKHDSFGLCITRSPPDHIRESHKLNATPILWLSEEKTEYTVPPTDLHGLLASIKDFLHRTERAVVILDGLEYLVTVNGFKPFLRLIVRLNDLIVRGNGILIIPALTGGLTERQRTLLIAQCRSLEQLGGSEADDGTLPTIEQVVPEVQVGLKSNTIAGIQERQPPLQFKRGDAAKVFRFLAKAFLQDYTVLRVSVDSAGWRTGLEIADGARLSSYRIYGQGGLSGRALAELSKRGLVETRWFPGKPGRGGTVTKVRVNHGNPYVMEEVDRLAREP